MKTVLIDIYARVFSVIPILSWVTASAICAIVGPFDTYNVDDFPSRLFFWGFIILVATIASNSIHIACLHYLNRLPHFARSSAACVIFSISYWGFLMVFIPYYYGGDHLPSGFVIFLTIFVVAAGLFGIVYYYTRAKTLAEQAAPQPVDPLKTDEPENGTDAPERVSSPEIMRRLGPEAGTTLVRMAMRDHYVEIYTEKSQDLIHLRFADALTEVPENIGQQVHRSHWVNLAEISGVERGNGKVGLRMSDGALVPVARSRKAELKELGII